MPMPATGITNKQSVTV